MKLFQHGLHCRLVSFERTFRVPLKNKSFESYVSAACCAFGKNLFGKRNDVVF